MPDIDSRLTRLIALRQEGRHADALPLLQQLFAEAAQMKAPARSRFFLPMLEWNLLAEAYAPARAAMKTERDQQIRQLLAGEHYLGRGDSGTTDAEHAEHAFQRASRFSLICQMNEIIDDARSTCELFARLDVSAPALARRHAAQALPAIVEAGDFALADRYRSAPLAHLDAVNATARDLPLFPAPGAAPRLAAELSNLLGDVRIGMAVLRGQGHAAQADAVRHTLLAGLASDVLRAMAQRELDDPGSITRELVAHQMAQERPAMQP